MQHEAAPTGRRLLHAGHDHAAVHDAAWQKRHKIYLVHKYVGIAVFVLVSLQVGFAFSLRRTEHLHTKVEHAHDFVAPNKDL